MKRKEGLLFNKSNQWFYIRITDEIRGFGVKTLDNEDMVVFGVRGNFKGTFKLPLEFVLNDRPTT